MHNILCYVENSNGCYYIGARGPNFVWSEKTPKRSMCDESESYRVWAPDVVAAMLEEHWKMNGSHVGGALKNER